MYVLGFELKERKQKTLKEFQVDTFGCAMRKIESRGFGHEYL